jgi:uncharacterized membrane protein YphA (DoxX/SURF4 family)
MKLINRFFIIAIGTLFIFSGAIKINDPVGTAIKLEEYFDVFATDFTPLFKLLTPYSLQFSIFLCAFEIILGVALLVNFRRKWVILSLLTMIIFFTFLTFYSAYFNKVTDCGCFGAVIHLTPWQSFSKDIALLIPLLLLTFQLKEFKNTQNLVSSGLVIFATIASFGVGIWAYNHLPLWDTSDYKVGNHIPTLMKPEEPCKFIYVMTKDGKDTEFENYPTDTTYKYKEMLTLNPEKCKAKITDYNIWKDTITYTQTSFEGKKLIIIIPDVRKANAEYFLAINELVKIAIAQQIETVVFTSSITEEYEAFAKSVNLTIPYYFADSKVLKTMIRSSPGIFYMENGVVKGKWHYHDVPKSL